MIRKQKRLLNVLVPQALVIILTLLTGLTAQAQSLKAPPIPEWPEDLPKHEVLNDGTFLPTGLDDAVQFRLEYLITYEPMCQRAINKQEGICRAQVEKLQDVVSLPPVVERSGWSVWLVGVTIVGTFIVGTFVGVGLSNLGD